MRSKMLPGESHVALRTDATQWRPYLWPPLDVWPLIGGRNESGANRIGDHVCPLLTVAIIITDAVIEGTALPTDFQTITSCSLEACDESRDT